MWKGKTFVNVTGIDIGTFAIPSSRALKDQTITCYQKQYDLNYFTDEVKIN